MMTPTDQNIPRGEDAPKKACCCGPASPDRTGSCQTVGVAMNNKPDAVGHLAIFNYHGIQTDAGTYPFAPEELAYVLPADAFRRQISSLGAFGFTTIDEKELQSWFDYSSWIKKPAMLTFDDGHVSHFDLAAPFLKEHGMKGIFFISSGLTGTDRYMTWDQVRQLAADGFDIGSHGLNHVPLTGLSEARISEEIEGSKKTIEDKLGRAVMSFSVPRGFFHSRIQDFARRAGYRFVFTSEFGVNFRSVYPLQIRRMAVRNDTSNAEFCRWLEGRIDASIQLEHFKQKIRNTVPPAFYDRLVEIKRRIEQLKPPRK